MKLLTNSCAGRGETAGHAAEHHVVPIMQEYGGPNMSEKEQDNLLYQAGDIFLWCFLLSVALLVLWSILYLVIGDWAYSIHGGLFELTRHDFTLVNYWGMAFTKICAIIFFLFPYVSIKVLLRKKRRTT